MFGDYTMSRQIGFEGHKIFMKVGKDRLMLVWMIVNISNTNSEIVRQILHSNSNMSKVYTTVD